MSRGNTISPGDINLPSSPTDQALYNNSQESLVSTDFTGDDMGGNKNEFGYQEPEKRDKIADAVLGDPNAPNKAAAAPTWSEFTQNTTFHGVKYMFEETPMKTRK